MKKKFLLLVFVTYLVSTGLVRGQSLREPRQIEKGGSDGGRAIPLRSVFDRPQVEEFERNLSERIVGEGEQLKLQILTPDGNRLVGEVVLSPGEARAVQKGAIPARVKEAVKERIKHFLSVEGLTDIVTFDVLLVLFQRGAGIPLKKAVQMTITGLAVKNITKSRGIGLPFGLSSLFGYFLEKTEKAERTRMTRARLIDRLEGEIKKDEEILETSKFFLRQDLEEIRKLQSLPKRTLDEESRLIELERRTGDRKEEVEVIEREIESLQKKIDLLQSISR